MSKTTSIAHINHLMGDPAMYADVCADCAAIPGITVELPTPVACSQRCDVAPHGKIRQSPTLDPGTPVILDGGSVAYATGYEVGGQFELRLGNDFGPIFTLGTVTPSTPEMLTRHRALILAASLNFALMTLADEATTEGSTDPASIEGLTYCRNAVSAVASNVKRFTY